MCLRFVFLLITRVASWLRLSQREETWKTAEILILRHQLAVLQRHQPRRPNLNWADRALLATLLTLTTDKRHRPSHKTNHTRPRLPGQSPNTGQARAAPAPRSC